MQLKELIENPENPSVATNEEIQRLKGKLERVPTGLTAMRIAYVTDKIDGKKMVISGNKRLRVLKEKYGDNHELPDEYFQDVTSMSEAERHEFIVTANISDGSWDLDKLLNQYDKSELNDLMGKDTLNNLIKEHTLDAYNNESTSTAAGGALETKFVVAPFSVFMTYKGAWQKRKKIWKQLIGDKGETRNNTLAASPTSLLAITGQNVSLLDPVLSEVITSWYCPTGGKTFDCFAGDSIYGCVSSKMGNVFTGIELRKEQADLNQERVQKFNKNSKYICDDGQNILTHIEKDSQDLFFSCPPYYDLEVYSDLPNDASNQGTYEDFFKIIDNAFSNSIKCLKNNRFAVVVCGDVRGNDGCYYDFPGDIKACFKKNGLKLYNDIILVDPIGNARLRCGTSMKSRKTVKIHQNVLVFYKGDVERLHKNVLVFYKGDTSKIKENFGEFNYNNEEIMRILDEQYGYNVIEQAAIEKQEAAEFDVFEDAFTYNEEEIIKEEK